MATKSYIELSLVLDYKKLERVKMQFTECLPNVHEVLGSISLVQKEENEAETQGDEH